MRYEIKHQNNFMSFYKMNQMSKKDDKTGQKTYYLMKLL